jgi:hypothetical protein
MKPPIDLDKLYADFVAKIGADRGDEHRLHGSDLGGCDYATYLRLKGEPRLPFDEDTIHRFYMGHMVEKYVVDALPFWDLAHGRVVDHRGFVGHLDYNFDFESHTVVIDVSTTRGKEAKPQYSHALKTAFYADAIGADLFAEWVFRIGYGGKVLPPVAYWFETKDFLATIDERVKTLHAIEFGELVPAIEPPVQMNWNGTTFVASGGLETWRCAKYCNAPCPRNQQAGAFNDALAGVEF